MDQRDSKVCEIANDTEHPYSFEKVDAPVPVNGKLDHNQNCTGGNSILQKQEHRADKEINGFETQLLPEKEKRLNYDCTSASDFGKGDVLNSSRPRSSVVSTSRNLLIEVGVHGIKSCAGVSTSFGNECVSSIIACDEISKDCEVLMQSLEGNDSNQHVSVKSDISLGTELFVNIENNEFYSGRTPGNRVNSEDHNYKSIMHTTSHCAQQKNESSSSNSTHVSHPISSSNESCPMVLMEVNSSKESNSGMDSSVAAGLGCSVEKLATGNFVIDMAVEMTKTEFDSVSSRNCKALGAELNSLIVEDVDTCKCSLLKQKNSEPLNQQRKEHSYVENGAPGAIWKIAAEIEQKVGIHGEASGSIPSLEDEISDVVHPSLVDFVEQSKRDGSTETGLGVKSCNGQDNYDSLFSNEEIVDLKKHLLAVKGRPQKLDPVNICGPNVGFQGKDSSQLPTNTQDDAVGYQSAVYSRVDLNEAIHTDNVNNPEHLTNEIFSSHNVKRVVAKIGVPKFSQMASLQFEGELGWKGSARTSAFRPLFKSSNRNTASSTSKNSCISRHSVGFTGIDLNVAANDDDPTVELPNKCVARSSLSFERSSTNATLKGKQRLNIDLNCLGENGDDTPPYLLPESSTKHFEGDFDLNDNPSLGDTGDTPWLSKGSQPWGNKALDDASVSFVQNLRQPDINCERSTYWRNLSSIQDLSRGHAQPFVPSPRILLQPEEQMQGVVCLHPKLTNATQILPSHSFLYSNPFSINPADPQSSTNFSLRVLPYIKNPHGQTVTPQILGFGSLPAFPGALHTIHGRNCSDVTSIMPRTEASSAESNSESRIGGGNVRQHLISPNSLREVQMKSLEPVALSATPLKRREPEGGWNSYQTGCRQVAPWH